MGCSGGLIAEAPTFSLSFRLVRGRRRVRTWLHGGAVSPVGLPSGAGSPSMGLGTEFHLLGHFRGPIPSAWVVDPGRWLLPCGDGRFCGSSDGFVGVFMGG